MAAPLLQRPPWMFAGLGIWTASEPCRVDSSDASVPLPLRHTPQRSTDSSYRQNDKTGVRTADLRHARLTVMRMGWPYRLRDVQHDTPAVCCRDAWRLRGDCVSIAWVLRVA